MNISVPAKKRFVCLLQVLESCNKQKITSLELSILTGAKDSLIRKDFSEAKISKGVSNGYEVNKLKSSIKKILGIKEEAKKKCCIVGLSRLGAALLDTSIFCNSNFEVVAGFDSNVNRTEILRSTFPLYPLSRLENVVSLEKIEYAILTVKDEEAIKVALRLEKAGIKGIVNYTFASLNLKNAKVEEVSPVRALMNIL